MRRYQIDRQRAIERFEKQAIEQNPPIQMVIPLAEVISQLQHGMKQMPW